MDPGKRPKKKDFNREAENDDRASTRIILRSNPLDADESYQTSTDSRGIFDWFKSFFNRA